MIQSGHLLAAALVIAAASPAAASPAFDAFRQVCGDTHGDFAAAKSAVSTGAWRPVEVNPSTMEGVTVSESVARAETVDGVKITVSAWHGTKGAVQISVCNIRVSESKFAELSQEAQAWTGFAPQTADPAKNVWRFTENGAARTAVQQSDYNAAAAGAGLDFFTISADRAETVLDLLKIKA